MLPRLIWTLVFYAGLIAPAFSQTAERIVSLGPAITRQIYYLQEQDKLVGVTSYCRISPQEQQKQIIGTLQELNVEKIIQLEPDLVLATALSSKKDIEQLQRLGLRVVVFSYPSNFEQICGQFLQLAGLLDKQDLAQAIIQQAKTHLETVQDQIKDLYKPKVFIQVGAKPLFTATGDSYLNDLINCAGGINIAEGAASGLYSREKVLEQDPEVIIITTMGLSAEVEQQTWRNYASLAAVQNNRIYIVEEYLFCSITPLDFTQALDYLVNLLHHQNE